MKITVLSENTAKNDGFLTEHGLSLYIETEKHRILFDMGQSEIFTKNAEVSGVDLSEIDIAILSHGHYDHGGGLEKFLEINSTAPVYIHKTAFNKHYSGSEKYIGLNPLLRNSPRIIFTDDCLKIDDGIELFSCNGLRCDYPMSNENMNVLTDSGLTSDFFGHEQYLLIEENDKKTLISGCSHKGIQNISQWLKANCIVGGFHLKNTEMNSEGKAKLSKIAKNLSENSTTYYTCHCTGVEQYEFMKEIMQDKLFYLHCGDEVGI